ILTTLNPKILSKNIKEKVIGQNDAVNNVIDSIVMMGVGLIDQNIPLNFYTAGPTGVGKNYLFEILSDELSKMFNTNVHYKEINCSSLKNEGAINQLIGSNKGYIESEEDSLLYKFYNKAKNCPFSVLLFDEFEKSHNNLIDFLLPILDKGKIYDNKENYLDFSGSLITFTSNIGYSNLRGNKRKNLGFSKNSIDDETDARKEYILGEINKKFTPEFLNRLNIVHFNYLNNDSIDKIFDLEFNKIRKRLENKHDVLIKYDKKLKNKIIENGFSKEYGARNIKNILNKNVAIPLAKHLHNDIKIDSKKSMEMIEYLNNLKKKINEDENNSFSRENVLKNVTGFINKNLDFSKILIKYNKNDELEFVKS
ncbi:MAG: AAA family ATPase, partial [Candidatus Woesearchaeota archaeon]